MRSPLFKIFLNPFLREISAARGGESITHNRRVRPRFRRGNGDHARGGIEREGLSEYICVVMEGLSGASAGAPKVDLIRVFLVFFFSHVDLPPYVM